MAKDDVEEMETDGHREKEQDSREKGRDKDVDREKDKDRRDDRDRDRRDKDRDRDRRDDRDRDRDRRDRDRDRDRRDRRDDRDRRDRDRKRDRDSDDERTSKPVNKKDQEKEQKVKEAEQKERTTGVYIPPFKLAMMMKNSADKSSAEYQRMTWDALKKSINGLINKVSLANIKNIVLELFRENLIRGRGLFCRSLMRAQHASPAFTNVYAALVAVVNTKLPENGELLLKRLAEQFKKGFRRNDKAVCLSTVRFIAHLSNQQLCGAVLPLEVILLLLEKPTDDSVEIAVEFMKEAGQVLQDLQPRVVNNVFDRFRAILHEGVSISDEATENREEIDKRVQYMIENLMAIRKSGFAEFPGVPKELDIVDIENQVTHYDNVTLDETHDIEDNTNYFTFDPNYLENEAAWDKIKADILGEEEESEGEGEGGEGSDESEGEESNAAAGQATAAAGGTVAITDATDTNLINLRRTIYLTIMSSVDFEECAHKLLKVQLPAGQEMELCTMLIECCSQERTYLRFYGLLGQRFCMLNKIYQELFDECFAKQYAMIHRLETNKLRNVAKFFSHLLHSDALNWKVLSYIHLNEEETTSSSRIFIKEISEYLGLSKLNQRLKDPFMLEHFEGLFPKDNPKNTRFAINFFTSIGLGGLTDDLREWLRNAPKLIMQQKPEADSSSDSDSSDSSSDSDSDSDSSDSSDSDSSSSSSSSDSEDERRKRRRK